MPNLHYLTQNSFLKLLACVFFAAFILTACGGGGDAAAPAAAGAATDDGSSAGDGGSDTPAITKADCDAMTPAQYFNASNSTCEDVVTLSDCDAAKFENVQNNACVDPYTPLTLADFQTAEYTDANTLAPIKVAEAYENIEALIDADRNSGTITQAGAGQIVSVASDSNFNVKHQEFANQDGSVAFDSIYIAAIDTTHTASDTLLTDAMFDSGEIIPNASGGGNCAHINICYGTEYAGVIAGRKDGTEMHGIAYNAQLRGITTNKTEVSLIKAVPKGVGEDVIAMAHAWEDYYTTMLYGSKYYDDPQRVALVAAELTIWRDAVSTIDSDSNTAGIQTPNNTIMVFSTGANGFNSENGLVKTFESGVGYSDQLATSFSSSVADANRPALHAAYPVLYDESSDNGTPADPSDDIADFTSDRWLVVVGLDTNNKIPTHINGCGVALNFCLAAPAQDIYAPNNNGTITNGYDTKTSAYYASSTVAGALAVLQGAFPNATPEELTALVLDTATYIPLADETAHATLVHDVAKKDASGDTRKINEVYGYGKLNLEAATSPSVTASYVTASNNTSIGALWKDSTLKLSSHFGGGLDDVKLGIGDPYGRHFTTTAQQTSIAPVVVGIDDYMAGFFGENIQSETLGAQARANYSNSTSQSWMDFEYKAGKATTKIAFQDSYKTNPLTDMGATFELRANNIRPASNNIGMMDVDYQLGKNVSLSSYAARGEYDTGYRFDELGTDIDLRHKKSTLSLGIGHLREHEQFLGTNTTGAYELSTPAISQFTDVTYGHDLGKKFNIYANYINYKTEVDMGYQEFATIENLQADQYQLGFKGKNLISDDDNLNVALITKLGVTDGALTQNTVLGYTQAGDFNNVTQSYDLAVSERHQQLEITYQGRLYQNTDKVSALKDNRFFTTLRVDQNLNHVQGASQTEIISGVRARF